MANTITTQTISDGPRNLIVAVTITGDGSGDEAATQLIDVSSYASDNKGRACSEVTLTKLSGSLEGFTAHLYWDATTDRLVASGDITGSFDYDWSKHNGIPNPKGTGYTGDIMVTTSGLGAGETGSFVMEMTKKYA